MSQKKTDMRIAERRLALQELFPEAFDGAVFQPQRLAELLNTGEDQGAKVALDWDGKDSSKVFEAPKGQLHLFRGEGVHEDNAPHRFIEGDNLDVLRYLRETESNSIKLMYIDPPYNTGKGFIYSDSFDANRCKDSAMSAWLSFMHPRLLLAKHMLKDDGVVFISIDDNAFGYLKVLADEIFGPENSITTFIWRRSGAGGLRGKFPVTLHEYVLCYTKDKSTHTERWYAPYSKSSMAAFSNQDAGGRFKTQALYLSTLKAGDNQRYAIALPDGTSAWPPDGGVWRFIEKTFLEKCKRGEILFLPSQSSPLVLQDGSPAAFNIYTKQYMDSKGSNPPSLLPEDVVGQTRKAKSEIKKVFGAAVFDYPKPVALIKYLLKLVPYQDGDKCMDFFAGSGSTCQAAFELNDERAQQLKVTAIQSAEPVPPSHVAHKSGFRFISDITLERMRRSLSASTEGFQVWRHVKD